MLVIYQKIITREDLRANPEVIFLFGDNLTYKGMGGQAKEMRGEPNAVGIPTKRYPSMTDDAFFCDDDFEYVKRVVDREFGKVVRWKYGNGVVVVPLDGLGTGLAKLPEKSPKIYEYIIKKIKELSE